MTAITEFKAIGIVGLIQKLAAGSIAAGERRLFPEC